jgi:hypothetical protein
MENIERLNKDHIKSAQVTRKLSAVAETQCFRSIQAHEVADGRIHLDVTTAGSCQVCGCKTAKEGGPESKFTHDDKASHREEDMTANSGDSDQLWKDHYVSSIAPAKR